MEAVRSNARAWIARRLRPPADSIASRPASAACLAMLAVCLICGLLSIHMKQDDSWDLQNYHLYNAFALLDGRLARDFWPGHLQTYFNPLLDLPYYVVARLWLPGHPRCVAFLAGLPYALLVPLAAALNWLILPAEPRNRRAATAALAALIGLTGTTVAGEIGTVFGDVPVAVFVLAGLLSVVAACTKPASWVGACALAGLCLGAAAGLKLTAAIYAPALGLAVLACAPSGQRLPGALAFCFCWAAAFLPPVLWWGSRLAHLYGSPVFPMMNTLFHSPYASATAATRDIRFLPRTTLQTLFYPFFWLAGRPFIVTEGSLREPRFAAAYLSLAWLAIQAARGELPALRARLLIVFSVAAYAIWQAVFSILRYAIPLEILTGTCITLAVLSTLQGARRSPGTAAILLAALLASLIAFQKPEAFGRLKRYGATTFDIASPALPDGAAVVVTSHPLSFVTPFLNGRDLVFIGLASAPPTPLSTTAITARLAAASRVFALGNAGSAGGEAALAGLGWHVDQASCAPVSTAFQAGIRLCRAVR